MCRAAAWEQKKVPVILVKSFKFAWEFLTETLGLPAEKLWVTVFEEDDEAADIWLKTIKVDASRFS